jgi:hypothetical protein
MLRWFKTDLENTKEAARASEAPKAKSIPVDGLLFICYFQLINVGTK